LIRVKYLYPQTMSSGLVYLNNLPATPRPNEVKFDPTQLKGNIFKTTIPGVGPVSYLNANQGGCNRFVLALVRASIKSKTLKNGKVQERITFILERGTDDEAIESLFALDRFLETFTRGPSGLGTAVTKNPYNPIIFQAKDADGNVQDGVYMTSFKIARPGKGKGTSVGILTRNGGANPVKPTTIDSVVGKIYKVVVVINPRVFAAEGPLNPLYAQAFVSDVTIVENLSSSTKHDNGLLAELFARGEGVDEDTSESFTSQTKTDSWDSVPTSATPSLQGQKDDVLSRLTQQIDL